VVRGKMNGKIKRGRNRRCGDSVSKVFPGPSFSKRGNAPILLFQNRVLGRLRGVFLLHGCGRINAKKEIQTAGCYPGAG